VTQAAIQPSKPRVLRHTSRTGPQYAFWTSPARFRFFIGGVGSGKTRAGCVEVLRQPARSIGMVIAPTYPMLRDATLRTFMDLAQRGKILKSWNKGDGVAELTDGKTILFRSADDPDRLRGPNLGWFYLDEAAMMTAEAWMVMIGRLRLAPGRAWATSTPRGMNWLAKLVQSGPDYALITSSTRENRYLPSEFVATLERTYTARMARQEIDGLFLDDVPGALWTRKNLDETRVTTVPDLIRITVGVDPTGSTGGDACGIVVVGKDRDRHGYVLEDCTVHGSPATWATRAVQAYHRWSANAIVAESNFGGDMVAATLESVPNAPHVQLVHSSRGKLVRAEPIASLSEHGRFHMVGVHTDLEEELVSFDGTGKSPNRLDAMVFAAVDLGIHFSAGHGLS
jgi:phage terminase large subunit-like protein